MKSILTSKTALLALMLVACGAVLAGCKSQSRGTCCPSLEGRCCGWDFYQPCDLIEGRAERQGRSMCRACDPCSACGICDCKPGIPVGCTRVVPADGAPAAKPVEAPADATETAPGAEEPVAEFGLPAPR